MYDIFEKKIKHYNLNLFCTKDEGITKETNWLIQNTLIEFTKENENYFKDHIIVLEYQDDIISSICYRMLLAYANFYDIKIFLYGKKRKTKELLSKETKFISYFKLKRKIKQDKVIFISVYNPIYQVVKSNKTFKNFSIMPQKLMEHFNYQNLLEARIFYHIGYIKNDIIEDERLKDFDDWYNLKPYNNFEIGAIAQKPTPKFIYLIELSNDLKENEEILHKFQDKKGIFFYKYDLKNCNPYEGQLHEQLMAFSYFLENSSNTFGYLNDANKIDVYKFASYINADIITNKDIKEVF